MPPLRRTHLYDPHSFSGGPAPYSSTTVLRVIGGSYVPFLRTECKRDHAARARTKEREVTTTQLWKVGILTTREDRTYGPCRARTGARGTAIQRSCANLGGHTILRVRARTYARWERSTWTVRPGSGASSFHHCYRHFESDASGKKIRFNSPIKWSIYGRMGQQFTNAGCNRSEVL